MNKQLIKYICFVVVAMLVSCAGPSLVKRDENKTMPSGYSGSKDSTNSATVQWKNYFTDPNLNQLIDSALKNNQELNSVMQRIEMARAEVRAKKGEYLPSLGIGGSAGLDKPGRYTSKGSSEATTEIKPGKETPDPLPDYMLGAYAQWEIDIWKKMRNAKKAAYANYLGSIEGKNAVVTSLIAEIANSYYELLALDNELEIVQKNIEVQTNALEVVRQQKAAAHVTELAVRRFEAQVLHTQALQYGIQQQIVQTENRINFLVGRFPQHIQRDANSFHDLIPTTLSVGLPSQLLENRPDIRQAEQELVAAKLDVKSAKARFYPSLGINAGIGFQAFNPTYLLQTPQSLMYSLSGDLMAPLINRSAIKAAYYAASAKQVQAMFDYEKSLLNAYIEVANQLSNIKNLQSNYDLKVKEVEALTQSVTIANGLFSSARADYMEVLLTQRDAIESKFELIEIKKQQMNAMVNMYRALGGGWN